MSRELGTRLFTDALFYDALSGEFTSQPDNQQKHTLGRLACAAFAKGARRINRESDLPRLACDYTPSWAPHVLALIEAEYVDDAGAIPPTLLSIELKDMADNSLYVANFLGDEVTLGLPDDSETRFKLELGDELVQTRAAITDATQRFFDSAVVL